MIGRQGPQGASLGGWAQRPWAQKGVLVTHLGWSQDLGWVPLEQELLAAPTAGSGEKGLTLIKPLPSCKERGGLGLDSG